MGIERRRKLLELGPARRTCVVHTYGAPTAKAVLEMALHQITVNEWRAACNSLRNDSLFLGIQDDSRVRFHHATA